MNDTTIQTINQTIIETINQSTNSSIQNITFMGQSLPFTGSPILDVFLITFIASLFMTLVNKYMSDQVKIKALRAEMKELQKKMRKQMTKNPEKAKQLQTEIMKKNMENMKHAFNIKVMLVTMLPMIALFTFVSKNYAPFGEFFTPFGLVSWGWLGTYLVFSLINSIVLKKVLDVA